MTTKASPSEYLVICRGQWDKNASRDQIGKAIDQFYVWLDRLVADGKMKRGQRLTYEGRTVGRRNVITDGPFGESKEVIGGYWFVVAKNLDEAAQIAPGHPRVEDGLFLGTRPLHPDIRGPDKPKT